MSSFFVWGCCFGFLTRAATAKMGHQCLTARPWTYPKYMLIGGVLCSYWGWARRDILESICEKEEKLEFSYNRNKFDLIQSGEELVGIERDNVINVAVNKKLP